MKLKKLDTKVVKAAKKKAKGKKISSDKLRTLKKLINEKKSEYKSKLAATTDKSKRRTLETKLKVVNAHLEKIERLLSRK